MYIFGGLTFFKIPSEGGKGRVLSTCYNRGLRRRVLTRLSPRGVSGLIDFEICSISFGKETATLSAA